MASAAGARCPGATATRSVRAGLAGRPCDEGPREQAGTEAAKLGLPGLPYWSTLDARAQSFGKGGGAVALHGIAV